MSIHLHTICLEPARWTPLRVSRPLAELLPAIARHGFEELEIFEPHLDGENNLRAVSRGLPAYGLRPAILSSYLNLNPAVTTETELALKFDALCRLVDALDFKRVRVFAGPGMQPDDAPAVAVFEKRLERLANRLSGVEILLETHDGSLADRPERVVSILDDLQLPNVGLLYQPTFFSAEAPLEQMKLQKGYVRHIHLQNRQADQSFDTLANGMWRWPAILAELGHPVSMTLEFVPAGICGVEDFDLEAVLGQARAEAEYASARA